MTLLFSLLLQSQTTLPLTWCFQPAPLSHNCHRCCHHVVVVGAVVVVVALAVVVVVPPVVGVVDVVDVVVVVVSVVVFSPYQVARQLVLLVGGILL